MLNILPDRQTGRASPDIPGHYASSMWEPCSMGACSCLICFWNLFPKVWAGGENRPVLRGTPVLHEFKQPSTGKSSFTISPPPNPHSVYGETSREEESTAELEFHRLATTVSNLFRIINRSRRSPLLNLPRLRHESRKKQAPSRSLPNLSRNRLE